MKESSAVLSDITLISSVSTPSVSECMRKVHNPSLVPPNHMWKRKHDIKIRNKLYKNMSIILL